jgi:AbrB family looped-hinge helix DNA binding protein
LIITKISKNGQVVIPMEVRKRLGLGKGTQFLVFDEEDMVVFKKITDKEIAKDTALARRIAESEENVRKGRSLIVDTSLPVEEIVRLIDAHARSLRPKVRKGVRKNKRSNS